jgi:hypothetical protein
MQVLKAKLEEEASCGDIQRFTSTSPSWIVFCVLCSDIQIDLVLNKVVVVTCDFGSRVIIDDPLSLCDYYDRNLCMHLSPFHTVKYGDVWLSLMHASSVCCMYLMIADFTNLRCLYLRCLYWCTWYGQVHV